MKKKIIYTLLCLFFGYVSILLLNSYFSRPNLSSKLMLIKRIEQLVNWRDSVKIYIEDNGTIPKNLFDVYSYCEENKKGIDLHLIIFPSHSMEESLLENERILKDQVTFSEKIDYEIVFSQKDWYIREKKVYSKYLRISELLTINSEGNISDNSLENFGVVLIDELSDEIN